MKQTIMKKSGCNFRDMDSTTLTLGGETGETKSLRMVELGLSLFSAGLLGVIEHLSQWNWGRNNRASPDGLTDGPPKRCFGRNRNNDKLCGCTEQS